MFLRKCFSSGLLVVCLAGTALAQSPADTTIVSLSVDQGVPLRVILTEKVPFKKDARVRGRLIAPVYAFDREVIPAGTGIEGVVTGFQKAGVWTRVFTMLGGDFTPQREPEIAFKTLLLPNGKRMPIETTVVPGTEVFVEAGAKPKSWDGAGNAFTSNGKKPGKDMLKNWLWGMSPYRPQYLPASLPVNAVLAAPLDFGVAEYEPGVLDEVGSAPPSHSGLSVRLVTALNSQTAKVGTPVEAVTTEPLFASNRHLILPVGSRVHGHVTAVDRARARHHNAELAFAFTSIEPPDLWTLDASEPRPIDATIDSIQGGHAMKHLRLSSDGATKMVESKKRFIAPAWAFIKAERSLNATADPFSTALLGAYRGKFVKEVTGGGPGLGLPASISGAMVPPLGVGFGFFGAARSIYSTFLKRGREINMPENTLIELTLDSGRE